jgi:putative DNA-invertase from lambdoid prophage Rac
MKRVAVYTRLSPKPETVKDPNKAKRYEKEYQETINQDRELLEYVSRQGWELIGHYRDKNISGGKKGTDRPEFTKMMQEAGKRKFDLVLFWSLDRLSREGALQTLQYLNDLTLYGVAYKSYTEQYLDSCGIFKEAIISIMAVMAKQERIRISERTKAGLQTAREKGIRLGRAPANIPMVEATELRKKGYSLKRLGIMYKVCEATMCRMLKGVKPCPTLISIVP